MDIEDKIRIADLRGRLSNIIKIGIVKEVDYNKAVARVSIGELTMIWLPWIIKAGEDVVRNCISVGGTSIGFVFRWGFIISSNFTKFV